MPICFVLASATIMDQVAHACRLENSMEIRVRQIALAGGRFMALAVVGKNER
jgi:hypothetical protein